MIATAQKTIADLNDGRGIQSVDVQYYLSASATALSGGSWSTNAPAWVNGKYMWSKTVTTYTDGGKKESTPACITGAKGTTGSSGKGVSSIAEQYYLSTSKTIQTGGSWVATPPDWSVGKYMWTRIAITYTDGTTTYTTPYCDSSWEAVNDLDVGGRNLLLESNFVDKKPFAYFNKSGYGFCYTGAATESNIVFGLVDNLSLKQNQSYTLSFIAWAHAMGSSGQWLSTDLWPDTLPQKDWHLTSTATKYSWTFSSSHSDMSACKLRFFSDRKNANGYKVEYAVYIADIKLEEGNRATDWMPAPEDTIPARRNLIENSSLLSNTTGWNPKSAVIYEWAEDSSGMPCGVYLTKEETTSRLFPLSRHPTQAPKEGEIYTISAEVCKYGTNDIPSGSTIFVRWYNVNGNYLERCTINIPTSLTSKWTRLSATGLYTPAAEWAFTDCTVAMGNGAGSLGVRRIKLEMGATATEWTAAPEDYVDTLEMGMALTNVKAEITNLGNSIRQEVAANYAATNDVVELGRKMQTLSEQTEENFSWSATEIETMKTNYGNAMEATEEQIRLIQMYMTFSQSGLAIGKTGNPFTFRVVNDRLAFFMNETEVAYLSNNKLYVTHAEILKSMRIGKFAFEPQTNGNLSLVYTG